MKKTLLELKMKTLCLFIALGCFSKLFAADLMDVYQQALENDPLFKAAYSKFMANSEALPQARAALLPQATATALVTRNQLRVNAGGFDAANVFNSNTWTLTVTQAVFNYSAWSKLRESKASVKAAHAVFNNEAQDLILRTAESYFEVLLARDTLNFAEAKLRANKRQLDQARQRFEVGLDAITSVYEAKAAYDQSTAEVIAARNNQVNQRENLRKLTNHVYENLSPLRDSKIPLIRPEPNNVDEWISTGLRQNYRLLSAKYNVQASRENIKAKTSGNWPTVAMQGQTTNTANNIASSNFFAPTREQISSVGFSFNFPFYQGGLVQSQTRQAQYDFQVSSEKLEEIYREVMVNSQIAFNTIIDGISKVKADRQTVISQTNSLESTEAQFQVGTRTMVDVVNAQQRLFEAQEQLASDQYGLIRAVLRLKHLSGTLNVEDLQEVNAWLKTTRISSFPPPNAQTASKKA